MTQSAAPPAVAERLPGARSSCALLTLLTVLLAWPVPTSGFAVLVRPAYFALLTWFFWRTSRASPALHTQAMRLVQGGFFVLWLGFLLAAVIHLSGLEEGSAAFVYLRDACERGAWFLLGTTLIAYGLMMWIPQVVQSHRLLAEHSAQQQGELLRAEDERTALEQRLIEADRLGMLGELAATIAHDLRNPLTVVKGTAESLCRRVRTPEEVAEHTDVIRRNIEKANQALEGLIDLAKPKAKTPADMAIRALLDEVHDLLHVEARRRGVRLVVAAAEGSAGAVRVDRALSIQALLNLTLNAIQASARDREVVLRARSCGPRTALCVEDRGRGLPPDVRAHLFQPFFTTRPNGTGLGLPSCRRIARELGGELRLYPRLRGGARAVLWLPTSNDSTQHGVTADGAKRCHATC